MIQPGKVYEQQPEEPFRITMASLGLEVSGEERCSLVARSNDVDFVLCNLVPNRIEQQRLDLVFPPGVTVSFTVYGPHAVHVTGNYVFCDEAEEGEECSDASIQEDLGEVDVLSEIEELTEIDEEIDSDMAEFIDDSQEELEQQEVKAASEENQSSKRVLSDTKEKAETKEKSKMKKKTETKEKSAKEENVTEKTLEKVNKKPKIEPVAETNPIFVKKFPNGLVAEDYVVGTGSKAKRGKNVDIRYVGKFTNGKVFDSNSSGKPFRFKLGRKAVIDGMDLGVQGMRVGGERRV